MKQIMLNLQGILTDNRPFFELIQFLSPNHFHPQEVPDSLWDQIHIYSESMHVTPLLFYRLKKYSKILPPKEIYEQLRLRYLVNAAKNFHLETKLKQVLEALEKENIPVIPLKGIILANTVYENPAMREMNDIDILVRWEDIKISIIVLESLGYRASAPYHFDDESMLYDHHSPVFINESGTMLELHWNITDAFNVSPEGLNLGKLFWEQAQKGTFLGETAYLLPPSVLIFHCAIHLSIQHAFNFGMREIYDIEELYLKYSHCIDWKQLMKRSDNLGLLRPLMISLTLTDLLTGTEIIKDLNKIGFFCNIPENYLNFAIHQFTVSKTSENIPFRLVQTNATPIALLNSFKKRILLSPKTMQIKYKLPEGSFRIYLCYPYRFFNLLYRFAPGIIMEKLFFSRKAYDKDFWKWLYRG